MSYVANGESPDPVARVHPSRAAAFRVASVRLVPRAGDGGGDPVTKRLAGVLAGMTAAASFALPAAPAHAQCISMFTTPVDCLMEAIPGCVYYGTFELVCLGGATG